MDREYEHYDLCDRCVIPEECHHCPAGIGEGDVDPRYNEDDWREDNGR